MSGDDHDSRRKHRCDHSDDDADKSSKRHKHRHRHRHRHSSKRRDEETKAAASEDIEAPPDSPRPAEDVEEGEILEDGAGGHNNGVLDSGADSGEIEAPGARERSEKQNLGHRSDENGSSEKSRRLESGSENGSSEKSRRLESGSPSKEGGQREKYSSEHVDDYRSKLSMIEKSPYRGSGELLRGRSRSGSHDHVRERSRSRSVVEEEAPSRRRSHSRSIMEEEALCKRRRYHDREISVYGSRERESRERDVDRVRRRERELERDRGRGRDRRREKEREE